MEALAFGPSTGLAVDGRTWALMGVEREAMFGTFPVKGPLEADVAAVLTLPPRPHPTERL